MSFGGFEFLWKIQRSDPLSGEKKYQSKEREAYLWIFSEVFRSSKLGRTSESQQPTYTKQKVNCRYLWDSEVVKNFSSHSQIRRTTPSSLFKKRLKNGELKCGTDLLLIYFCDQNSDTCERLFTPRIADLLEKHVQGSQGTILYITAVYSLIQPFRVSGLWHSWGCTRIHIMWHLHTETVEEGSGTEENASPCSSRGKGWSFQAWALHRVWVLCYCRSTFCSSNHSSIRNVSTFQRPWPAVGISIQLWHQKHGANNCRNARKNTRAAIPQCSAYIWRHAR